MIILESNYFPCIRYFKELANSTSVTIDQFESFKKMSFRNRCIVVGANGLINLTVPVEGGRNTKQLVKDVRISYSENWQQQHWKTILSSYAKSPFFEYYQHDVEQLIKNKNIFLIDKNMEIINWFVKKFKLQTTVELSNCNQFEFTSNDFSYIKRWLPSNYIEHSGTAIVYKQMFEEKLGFQENVSLLDLIFCEGSSKNILLNT
jgi:hypothetical protein